jgi:hypothetical protein
LDYREGERAREGERYRITWKGMKREERGEEVKEWKARGGRKHCSSNRPTICLKVALAIKLSLLIMSFRDE